MANAIVISLAVNAVVGVGWFATPPPEEPADIVAAIELLVGTEHPAPWTPTLIEVVRTTWARGAPPVVYAYPRADVTIGDYVEAIDAIRDLVPQNTIVVSALH